LRANVSRLCTCTIGRIDSTTNASVIRKPDTAAAFNHRGAGRPTKRERREIEKLLGRD